MDLRIMPLTIAFTSLLAFDAAAQALGMWNADHTLLVRHSHSRGPPVTATGHHTESKHGQVVLKRQMRAAALILAGRWACIFCSTILSPRTCTMA